MFGTETKHQYESFGILFHSGIVVDSRAVRYIKGFDISMVYGGKAQN